MIRLRGLGATVGRFRLEGITLDVPDGEVLAVLGPSGAGKTVLLQVVTGFVRPAAGSISIDGRDVTDEPPEVRRIAFVPQTPVLYPHLSVLENLRFTRRDVPDEKIRAIARLLQIEHLLERRSVKGLSGGESQRLALARAILAAPRALALDECFSFLDVPLRRTLQTSFRQVQRELKVTAILVTHDREEAFMLGHQVAVLMDGRLAQTAPPDVLWTAPASLAVAEFLGIRNRFRVDRIERTSGDVVCVVGPLRFKMNSAGPAGAHPGWLAFAEEDVIVLSRGGAIKDVNGVATRLTVTVLDVAFLGHQVQLLLAAEDAEELTFFARVPRTGFGAGCPRRGERLQVAVPGSAIRLIAG